MTAESRYAPVCYFAYARPEHTRATLAALARCEDAAETDLLVYADGPRNSAMKDRVAQVRSIVRAAEGFRNVRITERTENFGLSRSIIAGVSDACRGYGAAIVVEDDVLVSPHFLRFMNDALSMYETEDKVCSISGYMYPVTKPVPGQFFLAHSDCWGWATWNRAWASFEPDGAKLLAEIEARKLVRQFNLDGGIDLFAMLKAQIAGRNDSWAVRWAAVNFLSGKLTLYPGISMTSNIGNDGSGRHGGATKVYDTQLAREPLSLRSLPVEEDKFAREIVVRFLISARPALIRRIAGRVRMSVQSRFGGGQREGINSRNTS